MREFSERYLNILKGEFSGINLTRILDSEEFYEKQIIDTQIPFDQNAELERILLKSSVVVDVGFGGGFPILPLAKKYPNIKFIGLEARAKKVDVVLKIAKKLEVGNIGLFHLRIEDLLVDMDNVLFTFKAVSEIANLLPKINSTLRPCSIFFKGPSLEGEKRFKNLGWTEVLTHEYKLPSSDLRQAILLKKNVPRGTFSTKKLVKLSELL